MRGDKIGDDVAEAVKSFRCVFEIVGNVGLLVNELAAEVDDSYAYGVVLDVPGLNPYRSSGHSSYIRK